LSLLITIWYSAVGGMETFKNSIKFNNDGNYFIGKLFWKIVFNRGTQLLRSEEDEDVNVNEHHIRDDNDNL
jgi:hypothetical protein